MTKTQKKQNSLKKPKTMQKLIEIFSHSSLSAAVYFSLS